MILFSNTKAGEDGGEDFRGGYGARDGAQGRDAVAEVLGNEVAGNAIGEAMDYALGGGGGIAQGFVVARVGDEGIAGMAC